MLVEDQKLDAVVSLPGGVFKPYAGVSTAILLFTKTNSGGTDQVWFYDVEADGWSLDDKRTPLLPDDKLGPVPRVALGAEEHAKNNLPDVLARWAERDGAERERPRTAQSFCVPKADIAAQGYDLSLNRYKEVVHEAIEHRAAEGDPRRPRQAGGGDPAGDEGAGGDAAVNAGDSTHSAAWAIVRLGYVLLDIDAGVSPKALERPAVANELGVLNVSAVRGMTSGPTRTRRFRRTLMVPIASGLGVAISCCLVRTLRNCWPRQCSCPTTTQSPVVRQDAPTRSQSYARRSAVFALRASNVARS